MRNHLPIGKSALSESTEASSGLKHPRCPLCRLRLRNRGSTPLCSTNNPDTLHGCPDLFMRTWSVRIPLPKTMRRIGEGPELTTASDGNLVSSGLNEQEASSAVRSRDHVFCGTGVRLPYAPQENLADQSLQGFFVLIFQSFRVCRYCTAALGLLLKGFLLPRAIPPICFRRAIHAWRILREFYD